MKKVFTNQVQLLVTDGERVSIDKNKVYSFLSDICECFGLSVVCSPHTPKPENEIRSLKEKNVILKEELKSATEKPVANAIINHMENSAISLESVELYTSEGEYKPFFLIDDREKLNTERVAYINEILDNPNFLNQNKMTMYAALMRKDHKEMADLIEMAAGYGLDALPEPDKYLAEKRLKNIYKKYVELSKLQRKGVKWVDYPNIWC